MRIQCIDPCDYGYLQEGRPYLEFIAQLFPYRPHDINPVNFVAIINFIETKTTVLFPSEVNMWHIAALLHKAQKTPEQHSGIIHLSITPRKAKEIQKFFPPSNEADNPTIITEIGDSSSVAIFFEN